jgi:tetratricopeptide (TPR) repeat protein
VALSRQDPAAAQQLFRMALRKAPYHFATRVALAKLLLGSRPEEAETHLRVAVRVFPQSAEANYLLGQALEKLERPLEAAEAYRQAIIRNPRAYDANTRLRAILRRLRAQQTVVQRAADAFYTNPSLATLTLFGTLVMSQADPKRALLEFEEVRRREPTLPEVALWIARARHALGDGEEEIRAYQEYLQAHPDAHGIALIVAKRQQENGHYRDADESLERLEAGTDGGQGLPPDMQAQVTFLRSRLASAEGKPGLAGELLVQAAGREYDAAGIASAFRQDLAQYPRAPDLWFTYGTWLRQGGRLEEAVDAMRRAGEQDPTQRRKARAIYSLMLSRNEVPVPIHLALGELAFADGKEGEALTELEQVPPGDPLDSEASLLRGRIYRKQGRLDDALDAFIRYVLFFKDPIEMTYARGNVFWVLERYPEALALWEENPQVLERHPALLLQVAAHYQGAGDTQAETDVRERLARVLPENQDNLVRLGDLKAAAGQRSAAVALWERLLPRRPADPVLLEHLGRSYLALGQPEKSIPLLERAAQIRPLGPDLATILARARYHRQQFGEALRIYWQIYKDDPANDEARSILPELALNIPADPEIRRSAARVALDAGRLAQAAELLQTLIADQPEDQASRVTLAEVYLRLNQPEAAERAVLAPDTSSPQAEAQRLELLADIQGRLGRREALSDTLGRLLALRPDDPALVRQQALLLAGLNRFKEAEPLLVKAHQVAPEDAAIALALASVAQGLGEGDAAAGYLESALNLEPDNAEALRRLMELRLKQGQWDAAIPLLERWVERNPRDAMARYNLISAYLKEFRTVEARPHYEVLKQLNPVRARTLAPYFPSP